MSAPRQLFGAADVVACFPLLSWLGLNACSGLEAIARGGVGRSEIAEWFLIGVFATMLPASFLAAGATGYHTLLVGLSDGLEGRWRFRTHKRMLGRAALSALGFWLFSAQLGMQLD